MCPALGSTRPTACGNARRARRAFRALTSLSRPPYNNEHRSRDVAAEGPHPAVLQELRADQLGLGEDDLEELTGAAQCQSETAVVRETKTRSPNSSSCLAM